MTNRCVCGSTSIVAEATFRTEIKELEDGSRECEWVGEELLNITCENCGQEVRLDPSMTINLMHHLIEKKYAKSS